jgi:hypothetical protein
MAEGSELSISGKFPLLKGFWLVGFRGVETRSVVIYLANGLFRLGGGGHFDHFG